MAKDSDQKHDDGLNDEERAIYQQMKDSDRDEDTVVVSGDDEASEEPEVSRKVVRDEKGRFTVKDIEDEESGDAEKVEAEGERTADEEQGAEGEDGGETEEQKRGWVPTQALDRERGKRQDAESQLAEMQRQLQWMQQQMQHPQAANVQQAPQPGMQPGQAQAPAEPPDPVLDPEGYKQYWESKFQEAQKPWQQLQQAYQQTAQQEQAVRSLKSYAENHEQQFREQYGDRDYDGALEFMRERTARNLQVFGTPKERIPQALAEEEKKLVAMAYQQGMSPAAVLYNLAVNNGYQPGQGKQKPQDEAERVSRLARAQKDTQSAAGLSGRARSDEYGVEDLANMSEKELAKIPDEVIKKALGG